MPEEAFQISSFIGEGGRSRRERESPPNVSRRKREREKFIDNQMREREKFIDNQMRERESTQRLKPQSPILI